METRRSLLTTKLFMPAAGRHIVRRPRLEERLKRGSAGALTLICAPAGFGKTTILTNWFQSQRQPVAWVSLDTQDNDPVRFLTYWIAALQRVHPALGVSALEQLQSPQPVPLDGLLIDLLNDMTAIGDEVTMAVDDYHCIEAQPVHGLLAFFLENIPPTCHICLTTRSDPPFPLARLRSRGLLTEIRAKELTLTHEEMAEMFRALDVELSEADVEALRTRTEGWAAGVQLAGLSMQHAPNIPEFVRKFGGTHRYIVDYLVEEVLFSQSPDVQDFLLRTSILDRLCGGLCDAVAGGTGSQQILEHLDASDFFLFALDEERCWFRYHHLLSDILRQRLQHADAALVPALHQKAARWYAGHQLESEALRHAYAAEDYELAAAILERVAEQVWEGGSPFSLLHWFEQLPDEALQANPALILFSAKELLYAGKFEEAGQTLSGMAGELDSRNCDDREPPLQKLRGRMAVMQTLIAMYLGDIPTLLRRSEEALRCLTEEDRVWRGMVYTMMGVAYYWDGPGNIRKAKTVFAEALALNKHENVYTRHRHKLRFF